MTVLPSQLFHANNWIHCWPKYLSKCRPSFKDSKDEANSPGYAWFWQTLLLYYFIALQQALTAFMVKNRLWTNQGEAIADHVIPATIMADGGL